MATLDSILSLLNKWPAWQRITNAPDRIDSLEKRVAALEAKIEKPQKTPGRPCKYCGESALRMTKSLRALGAAGILGVRDETWTCESCGKTEQIKSDR